MDAAAASNCVTCCEARSAAVSLKRSTWITLPRAATKKYPAPARAARPAGRAAGHPGRQPHEPCSA
eukprot:2657635-Alexandrium_andersonii.AAC.1